MAKSVCKDWDLDIFCLHENGNGIQFFVNFHLFNWLDRCFKNVFVYMPSFSSLRIYGGYLYYISYRLILQIFFLIWSHFILGGLNCYVLTSTNNNYNVLIVFILYCKIVLLLLRWDIGKVRDRFGGIGRFKVGLRCKGRVNSVIINVIT